MDRHALRLTHPEPARIGQAFRGDDEGPALAGETYSSRAEGSLGTSIRGFAPVLDARGDVLGAVSVGVTLASLGELLSEHRRDVVVGVLVLMLLTVLGAHLLARYIKRVLLGLEPYEITRTVEERQAMLASVREGVLAVDDQARITWSTRPRSACWSAPGWASLRWGGRSPSICPPAACPKCWPAPASSWIASSASTAWPSLPTARRFVTGPGDRGHRHLPRQE